MTSPQPTPGATPKRSPVSKDADDSLQRATQVFCGVRMLCARCHAHPFENWTQDDYYGLRSFFTQVAVKADTRMPGVRNARVVLCVYSGNLRPEVR